jgi:hypothetical protein
MKMQIKRWHTHEKISIGLFIILLFTFVMYRSFTLDFTNDEAYTFFNVDSLHIKMMLGTANTHWLNSICIFLENALLGNKEWMLRIHSSICVIFFSYFVIRTYKHSFSNYLILVPIAFIVCNHYFLDYFSMSRGYSMSLMFEAIAFYHIIHHRNRIFTVYSFLALAVMSNYTVIYILYAYFLLDVLSKLRNRRAIDFLTLDFYTQKIPFFLVSIIALPNIFYIKYWTGDLDEGSSNGYVKDSIAEFFVRTFHPVPAFVCYWVVLACLVAMLAFYFTQFSKMKSGFRRLFEVFFLVSITIYFLFYVLHVPYPDGRVSFFIVLLFLYLMCYIILFFLKNVSNFLQILLPTILLVVVFTFTLMFRNLSTTLEFWHQQGLRNFCKDMKALNLQEIQSVKLGMSLDHYGAYINYYHYINPSQTPDSIFVYGRDDYKKMNADEQAKFAMQDYLLMVNNWHQFADEKIGVGYYKILKTYPNMKSALLQVKK